jgi:hypothetical protein
LPDFQGGGFQNIGFDVASHHPDMAVEEMPSIFDGPIKVVTPAQVRAFCRTEDSTAPALGLYMAGKRVMWCRSFVEHQQELWRRAVERAGRIYVIGAAIYDHDSHIWDVLANAKG